MDCWLLVVSCFVMFVGVCDWLWIVLGCECLVVISIEVFSVIAIVGWMVLDWWVVCGDLFVWVGCWLGWTVLLG